MTTIQQFITRISPDLALLPLMHNCDAYDFKVYLEQSEIIVEECDVFKKEFLIYTFYGKPSYRVTKKGATKNPANFPVCFILNTSKMNPPYRIFPFDTGAFFQVKGMKEKYFHEKMKIEHFELIPDFSSPKKLIRKFYKNNENYYRSNPKLKPINIPTTNFEVWSYCSMINDETDSPFDDRLTSVEVIFNQNIPINKDNLQSIILPGSFLDDHKIKNLLTNKFGVAPVTYSTTKGSPLEYHGLIYNEVEKFMTNNKILQQ
jgi:hypothetical protein